MMHYHSYSELYLHFTSALKNAGYLVVNELRWNARTFLSSEMRESYAAFNAKYGWAARCKCTGYYVPEKFSRAISGIDLTYKTRIHWESREFITSTWDENYAVAFSATGGATRSTGEGFLVIIIIGEMKLSFPSRTCRFIRSLEYRRDYRAYLFDCHSDTSPYHPAIS